MVPIPTLVETLVTTPLNALESHSVSASHARRKRLRRSAADFYQATLAIHLHWAAHELGMNGPWVWANGNPHPQAFTTLASGPRQGVEPPATTYELSAADDEHPAPWHWDLLRCCGGLGVWWKGEPSAVRQLSATALDRYREVMLRAADGDADHGGRVFVQDLPTQVVTLLEQDGDSTSEARWQRLHLMRGRVPRFRRTQIMSDEPEAAALLDHLREWCAARASTLRAIDAVCCAPNGLSPYPDQRCLILAHDGTALRCLEVSLRRKSDLAPIFSACSADHPLVQPITFTVPLGRDPWHQVTELDGKPYLIRTRCHAQRAVNPGRGTKADRHLLVKLWATVLANAHLRGLACLGADVAANAEAIAADVMLRRDTIASLCSDLPSRNWQAWSAYCASDRLNRAVT